MAGPWEDFQTSAAPASGPWEDFQQAPAQAPAAPPASQYYPDTMTGADEAQAIQGLAQQHPGLEKAATGLVHNVQPFIEHPFSSAYNMVVPNAQDFQNIAALTKPETYQQNIPIGSQEYYDQVVGNALPLALMGAGMFKGRGAPEAVPNVDAAVRESMAQPEPDATQVRLYHGGAGEQAGSDFTTSRQYAEDYAAKTPGGKVWSVDVPEGTLKTHDEYGQPMTRVVVPDEIANQAKPLQPQQPASTIQSTPDELSSSQAQAGQRDTALRAEPQPAAVGGAGAPEGAAGGQGADAVSIKNAYTDAAREKYGLTPAVQEARKSLGQSLVEAQSAESREPGTARRLVDDINSGRVKAIDDNGDGLLTIETIDAQVERSAAEDAVNNARTPDELDSAKARLAAAKDRQQAVYDADKLAGTHTARGLKARQMVARNDYSLTRMEGAARAAQNRKPLSDKQSAYIQDLHNRIDTLEKQASQYEAGKVTPRAERMRIKSDAITARKSGKSLGDFLSEKADAARERIRQMEDVGVDCI